MAYLPPKTDDQRNQHDTSRFWHVASQQSNNTYNHSNRTVRFIKISKIVTKFVSPKSGKKWPQSQGRKVASNDRFTLCIAIGQFPNLANESVAFQISAKVNKLTIEPARQRTAASVRHRCRWVSPAVDRTRRRTRTTADLATAARARSPRWSLRASRGGWSTPSRELPNCKKMNVENIMYSSY